MEGKVDESADVGEVNESVGGESSETASADESCELAFGCRFYREDNWFVVAWWLADDVECDRVVQCREYTGVWNASKESGEVVVVHDEVGGFSSHVLVEVSERAVDVVSVKVCWVDDFHYVC